MYCRTAAVCGLALALAAGPCAAGPLTTIFNLDSPNKIGDLPSGPLIADSSGALYGTTVGRGTNLGKDRGTAFKISPPPAGQRLWTGTLLHLFNGGSDSMSPNGGLAIDPQGAVYGTTPVESADIDSSTIFKISPPAAGQTSWTETIIGRLPNGAIT